MREGFIGVPERIAQLNREAQERLRTRASKESEHRGVLARLNAERHEQERERRRRWEEHRTALVEEQAKEVIRLGKLGIRVQVEEVPVDPPSDFEPLPAEAPSLIYLHSDEAAGLRQFLAGDRSYAEATRPKEGQVEPIPQDEIEAEDVFLRTGVGDGSP
jgi:hypothetical protein